MDFSDNRSIIVTGTREFDEYVNWKYFGNDVDVNVPVDYIGIAVGLAADREPSDLVSLEIGNNAIVLSTTCGNDIHCCTVQCNIVTI